MKKKGLIVFLVGLLLVALTGSAFAWSPRLDGKPDQFYPGGPRGYYVWHDDNGFHIWTTNRGSEHTYSGVIRTDGRFVHVRGHNLEEGDSFKLYSDARERTWFEASESDRGNRFVLKGREVGYDNDKIRFKFDTIGGSDGLNFRIKDASYVEFDLFVDGHPVNHREIHIGDNGWHPHSHHFRFEQ